VHQGGTAEGLYHNDHGAMKQHQLFTSIFPFSCFVFNVL
jgi:hypothetical protein